MIRVEPKLPKLHVHNSFHHLIHIIMVHEHAACGKFVFYTPPAYWASIEATMLASKYTVSKVCKLCPPALIIRYLCVHKLHAIRRHVAEQPIRTAT